MSRFTRAATSFVPSLLLPQEVIPSITVASTFLFAACLTLTYRGRIPAVLRTLFAFPIIYFSYDVGFGPYETANRKVALGLALVGLMGMMRAWDVCFASYWDEFPPMWIKDGKSLPIPTTILDRLMYAFDLLTSVRGGSWLKDTVWDWAPRSLIIAERPTITKTVFLLQNMAWLAFQYILMDIFDTINHSRTWDVRDPHPITSLAVREQILFSISICVCTALSIASPNIIYSTIFIPLGSDTGSWSSLFAHPFQATSLQDFWTHKWHHTFRRVNDRMTACVLNFIPSNVITPNVRKAVRGVMIFSFTATCHLFLVHRASRPDALAPRYERATDVPHPPHTLLDSSTLAFFMSQPLGFLIERTVIFPVSQGLPGPLRITMRRAWAWFWLIFSGRFWCEAWIRAGLWSHDETMVGWSPVRGLWKGEWWLLE